MPSAEQLRSRLLKKLSELFQLDQPDLDFGFYRIMHAKAQEVQDFIGTDLLKIVTDAFGDVDEARKAELQAAYDNTVREAKEEYGIVEPEKTPKAQKAKAALDEVKDTAGAEADVYDHLYRFFERYYDDGDFISRRYYTRETSGKAAPFAVPYNGEEVKLHWANADQYYIKSAEYFSNFTFDLRQAQEIRAVAGSLFEPQMDTDEHRSLKVHFKVLEATEGEHGNVKASEQNKRFFIIHNDRPVEFNEAGELICNFEYRPDPEKTGQEGSWRDKRNAEAVNAILDFGLQIADLSDEDLAAKFGLQSKIENLKSKISEYFRLFKIPAPTDKDKKRPVLAKYVNQYTARNTMDYFIHKDLGAFLRRELDFYIKNEVMRLDDIENAEAPAVESYLAKIKVLRKIAGKLIDFLAQLEDFQKKLWLKKKFIIETNYCITLDRVPEALYEEITACDAQLEEWVKLGFVKNKELEPQMDTDEHGLKRSEPDLFSQNIGVYPCESVIQKLKANNKLVLDSRFFDDSFKARIVASIENFDEQCDGLLIHSENFQALNLLQERYREQVKCVYIDPPYNTEGDDFCYKDQYKSSSWCAMMYDRLEKSKWLLPDVGTITSAIGREELLHLLELADDVFGLQNRIADLVWEKGRKNDAKYFSLGHDYMLVYGKNTDALKSKDTVWREEKPGSDEILDEYNRLKAIHADDYAAIQAGIRAFYQSLDKEHPALKHRRYNRVDRNGLWRDDNISWPNGKGPRYDIIHPKTGLPCKVPDSGWRFANPAKFQLYLEHDFIEFRVDHTDPPLLKRYLNYVPMDFDPDVKRRSTDADKDSSNVQVMPSVFYKGQQPTVVALRNLMGGDVFRNPKEPAIIARLFKYMGGINDSYLDYFAGSGTTGHAVVNLNRSDNGNRKYILVEMGDHFDTILKPRIAKVVYSESWKDGKPVPVHANHRFTQIDADKKNQNPCSSVSICDSKYNGISHCFKYIRLESYEDTLNNLRLDHNPQRKKAVAANPALKEDYMLRYLLDVETRGSQSLLNIDAFADPTAYTLDVKKPGTDEYATRAVDLIETFNYLIGLRVLHSSVPQTFQATFKRITDPELPEDQHTKLVVDGRIRQDEGGPWWFRKVEGWVPKDAANPNNGQQEKVLVVWRKLTDDIEQDNLMLDEWFQKNRISTRDFEFDTIYVNGSNNLPNLKLDDENWKVRLIEEAFMKHMWEVQQ